MFITKLPLKKNYYEEYLRWYFKSAEGTINISRTTMLGKFITALAVPIEYPVKEQAGLPIAIPAYDSDLHKNKFYTFTPDVVDKINDMIEFYFDSDLREWCLVGGELNMQRKDIYSLFLKNRNLKEHNEIFEMIKKRDWRRRTKMKEILLNAMQSIDNL